MSKRILYLMMAVLTASVSNGRDLAATAFDFEAQGSWRTAPLDLPKLMRDYQLSEADLWCSQSIRDSHWVVKPTTLAKLSSGLTLANRHVKSGATSGLWKNLPRYPTLASEDVPTDWSQAAAVEFDVYSEAATGDTIYLGVRSPNGQTPERDFYLCPFKTDFTGWRHIVLPFARFESLGTPAGWHNVSAVYFFAKAYGHLPNPYTELHLDHIRLSGAHATAPETPQTPAFRYILRHQDKPLPRLNHAFPEKASSAPVVSGQRFITHQPYFLAERALYAYYPRFNAGYPSIAPDGCAYIYSGDKIQWRGPDGLWQACDLKPVLIQWAKRQGWQGFQNEWGAQGGSPVIRFDNDGDIYVLVQAEQLNDKGSKFSWKTRCTLMLHSRDRLKTWTVYQLPGRRASFEKLDGHNTDCLKRPPVLMLSDYGYFPEADPAGYLLLPEKRPDGNLDLSNKVKFSDQGLDSNVHSGDGNLTLSAGGKIIIVYGWAPSRSRHPETVRALTADGSKIWDKWKLPNLLGTPVAATLPPIPKDHPGLKLSSRYRMHLEKTSTYPTAYSRDGVPTFAISYDIASKTLSEPVYIGSGGGAVDNHNWPAITVDSKGLFHVIINGHHNPAVYTHTLRPFDISEWSTPEYVIPSGSETPLVSYATLNCDRHDTLYTTHRSTTGTYNNRITLFRKKSGQPWEKERTLVAPFKRLYTVWYQRMCYDPYRDRLYLTYFSNSRQSFLWWDMTEFLMFYRPDQEASIRTGKKLRDPQKNPFWDSWTNGAMRNPAASGIVTLISKDGAETWDLSVTEDFQP
jgi:hypothetical protein